MVFLASHGFRCIAHDRRGHGRSGQSWTGNDMDTYADDLAELMEALDVTGAALVGHSTGGGEVARYIGRHGSIRVAKVVLIGAVTPLMLQTPDNPTGVPLAVFDGIRAKVHGDRSQFFQDLTETFYGEGVAGAAGFVLDAGDAGGIQRGDRLHHGVFGDRFYGGLAEVHGSHADCARRRRPDCADGEYGDGGGATDRGLLGESLRRGTAWAVFNA